MPKSISYSGEILDPGGQLKKYIYFSIFIAFSLLVNSAFAKPGLIKDIGIGAGVNYPQGGWNLGYIIQAQTNFGEVLDYLFLSPFVTYSAAGKTEKVNGTEYDMKIEYIGFGAKMIGYINAKPRGFYVGGSLDFNVISAESLTPGHIDQNTFVESETMTKLGLAALAGYKLSLKKISFFIEANYMLVPGGYNYPSFLLGTSINM